MFTETHARVLRYRLLEGSSVIDPDGNEVPVSNQKKRRRPPEGEVPTVAQLLTRYAHCFPDGDPAGEAIGQEVRSGSVQASLAALKARQGARALRDANRDTSEMRADMAHMTARLIGRSERRKMLACYVLDPLAGGNGTNETAAAACEAVKAHRDCEWRADAVTCPRGRIRAAYDAMAERLKRAGVPVAPQRRLRAAMAGHRSPEGVPLPIVPLEPRPALSLVAGWQSRQPCEVSPWKPLRGDETLLILSGASGGEGKTFAGCWSLAAMDGMWITAAELVQLRADAYDRDSFLAAAVLVIDDAGTEALTEWGRGRMYDLIASRVIDGRLTLVTTNMERGAFCERYDARLSRRIDESGRFAYLSAWQP